MKLSDKCLLVSLNISQWSGEKHDRVVTERACESFNASNTSGKFKKFLMSKSALGAIKTNNGAARNRFYELTLPWDDSGWRIIASSGYLKLKEEMAAYKRRTDELVSQFLDDAPSHIAEAQALLGEMFNPADYPTNGELAARFAFSMRPKPVPEANDFRVQLADSELKAIRDELQADTETQLGYAMQDVAARIKDAITHMRDRLESYDGGKLGSFKDTLVSNMRDLVDILPSLNITDDKRINEVIADVRRELTLFDASDLRDDSAARTVTAKKANEILQKMAGYGL